MARSMPEVKSVKIPVVVENGQIVPADTNLKLKDRTLGELTVLASAVIEEKRRRALISKMVVEILPADTMLIAVMKPCSGFTDFLGSRTKEKISPNLLAYAVDPRKNGEQISTSVDGIMVAIHVLEPLKMELRGGAKVAKLHYCKCFIPALEKEANSVNHAYSLLSEVFEPHRMSHTGNVFKKVCYLNRENTTWEPLEDLRYIEECHKEVG